MPSRLARELAQTSAAELALRLQLVALLLHPVGDGRLRPVFLALAAAGLLLRGLAASPLLWLGLAALAALRLALHWPLGDNHAYLLGYWCLAAALALASARREEQLAASARLLLGLTFALAVLWKAALSPDFLGGTFFRVTLLTDPRFEGFTGLVTGLDAAALRALRGALLVHVDGPAPASGGIAALPAGLAIAADALTAATLLLEAALAAAFLVPRAWRPARLADPLLLLFCAGTFALAPVEGFGWLLLSMGVAQCPPSRTGLRALYVAVFVLLLAYRWVPFALGVAGNEATPG
jgi:hypothetical protein